MTDADLLSLVNASGYPFQLKVEHEIRKTFKRHRKEILATEHKWEDRATGDHGFIDLVLRTGMVGRVVIECKRVQGGGQWVFLVPNTADGFVHWARFHWSRLGKDRRPMSGWDGFNFKMMSHASSFCVVRGHGEKTPSMLERLGGWLVKATECLAEEELQFAPGEGRSTLVIYFPTIITNAKLMICKYDPEVIGLEDGMLPQGEFAEVPFIRFTKSLPSRIPSSRIPSDLGASAEENQRTILIVNANWMIEVFGGTWEMADTGMGGVPWESERWRTDQ
jgi:hypothetical protein